MPATCHAQCRPGSNSVTTNGTLKPNDVCTVPVACNASSVCGRIKPRSANRRAPLRPRIEIDENVPRRGRRRCDQPVDGEHHGDAIPLPAESESVSS